MRSGSADTDPTFVFAIMTDTHMCFGLAVEQQGRNKQPGSCSFMPVKNWDRQGSEPRYANSGTAGADQVPQKI